MIIIKIKLRKFGVVKQNDFFNSTMNASYNINRSRVEYNVILHNLFNLGFFTRLVKSFPVKINSQKIGYWVKNLCVLDDKTRDMTEGYIKMKE